MLTSQLPRHIVSNSKHLVQGQIVKSLGCGILFLLIWQNPWAAPHPGTSPSAIEDRNWRREYFSSQKWNIKKPKLGEKDGRMVKFEHHASLGISGYNSQTPWEKQMASRTRRLFLRRERYKANQAIESSSDDDGTSSNSSLDSSSSSPKEGKWVQKNATEEIGLANVLQDFPE